MALDQSDPLRLGSAADIAQVIEEAIQTTNQDIRIANVLIAGNTGVGKSTLINAVFSERLATTDQESPLRRRSRSTLRRESP